MTAGGSRVGRNSQPTAKPYGSNGIHRLSLTKRQVIVNPDFEPFRRNRVQKRPLFSGLPLPTSHAGSAYSAGRFSISFVLSCDTISARKRVETCCA